MSMISVTTLVKSKKRSLLPKMYTFGRWFSFFTWRFTTSCGGASSSYCTSARLRLLTPAHLRLMKWTIGELRTTSMSWTWLSTNLSPSRIQVCLLLIVRVSLQLAEADLQQQRTTMISDQPVRQSSKRTNKRISRPNAWKLKIKYRTR